MFFDASEVEPQKPFDPVPPGWYAVTIVGAEEIESEKAGAMLKLTYEIDGQQHIEFAGRNLFSNLCLNHPTSQQAAEIARRSLSSICHAIGKMQLMQVEDLLGGSLRVKVKVTPPREGKDGKQYDASNEISGYKPIDGSAAETAPTKPAAPTAGKPTPTAAAPVRQWKK
jgi:hypothetical protein